MVRIWFSSCTATFQPPTVSEDLAFQSYMCCSSQTRGCFSHPLLARIWSSSRTCDVPAQHAMFQPPTVSEDLVLQAPTGRVTFSTWALPQGYEVPVEGTVAGRPQAIVYIYIYIYIYPPAPLGAIRLRGACSITLPKSFQPLQSPVDSQVFQSFSVLQSAIASSPVWYLLLTVCKSAIWYW